VHVVFILQFTLVKVGSILFHPWNIFALPHKVTTSECPCNRKKAADYAITIFLQKGLLTIVYTANIMEAVITLTKAMNLFYK
jgi:hypothetical protein